MEKENLDFKKITEEYEALKQKYEESATALGASKVMLNRLNESYTKLQQEHQGILNSRGYRLLLKLYNLRNILMPLGSVRWAIVKGILKPLLFPFLYLGRKISAKRKKKGFGKALDTYSAFQMLSRSARIDIVAIPHTKYVAELLRGVLLSAGIGCNIHLGEPPVYEDIPYIMICPQNFKRFPKLYIAFQMEQTINPRWLTDEYFEILHNAYAVFDYSMVNIEFFNSDPIIKSKLYYMPIDVCMDKIMELEITEEKEYDVLFYGDPYIDRRKEYLDKIGEKFNLKVISNLFGEELYKEMRKAKIIINAHYYENALLETTRLYEALSVSDTLIISEKSGDKKEEIPLETIVDFTEIGDIDEMVNRIEYWLSHDKARAEKVKENLQILRKRANATKFYLYRFLLANDTVSFDDFYKAVSNFINFENDRICLSIPECIDRRDAFIKDNKYGFTFFPALKHYMGWVGCGMSYKFILKRAKDLNFDKILVCEDDVYFPEDFEEKFEKVLKFTEENDDWNVFSGIMADVGRVKILKHENKNDVDFVYLDKMISMVFNIYDKSVFDLIGSWDNTNRDVEVNAIDRYLEDEKLRILTTCPFLVGHKEDLNSTIWGKQNTIYSGLIEDSSKKLREMTDKFKANK